MSIHLNDDGAPNPITYLFTDLNGDRIADLPLSAVSFTLAINSAGQFTGTLNVEDPRLAGANWIEATRPNLTQVWVDISGTLVYGGVVNKRTYQASTQQVSIQGMDHFSYLSQRVQGVDYSTTWAKTAAGAAQIAHKVLTDALNAADSLPLSVSTPAATPSAFKITMAAPVSQRMTIDSLVQQIATLGYRVGFDYAMDVAYVAGVPTATVTLSYPRRGRVAGVTGLVMDLARATDFTYDEDGTSQANRVFELATGAGSVGAVGTWAPSITVDGYPLLEKTGSHASMSPAATPQAIMTAYAQDDLALSAYPVVTPQVTMPMFTEPAIGTWIAGDDVRVVAPKLARTASATSDSISGGTSTVSGTEILDGGDASGPGGFTVDGGDSASSGQSSSPVIPSAPGTNPRFPDGMDFYWRITRADCTIPTEGVPTVQFTLGMPPTSLPQRSPQ